MLLLGGWCRLLLKHTTDGAATACLLMQLRRRPAPHHQTLPLLAHHVRTAVLNLYVAANSVAAVYAAASPCFLRHRQASGTCTVYTRVCMVLAVPLSDLRVAHRCKHVCALQHPRQLLVQNCVQTCTETDNI